MSSGSMGIVANTKRPLVTYHIERFVFAVFCAGHLLQEMIIELASLVTRLPTLSKNAAVSRTCRLQKAA